LTDRAREAHWRHAAGPLGMRFAGARGKAMCRPASSLPRGCPGRASWAARRWVILDMVLMVW